MQKTAVILAVLGWTSAWAAPAYAEDPLKRVTQWRIDLKPALGESIRNTDGNEPVDESEAALAVKVVRPLSRDVEIEAMPAVAYSPQFYDKADPSSQFRVNVELRRRFTFGEEASPARYARSSAILAQLFGGYAPSVGFDDFFGKRRFFDNTVAAGVRFGDKLWFRCRRYVLLALGFGCRDGRKLQFEVAPSLQYSFSDQSSRRRFTPQASAKAVLPLRDLDIRFTTKFENRRFTALRLAGGDLQRDGRVTAGLSFDFAPAMVKGGRLAFAEGFSAELGARYVRNRSNDRTRNFDRVFFVPALSYARALP